MIVCRKCLSRVSNMYPGKFMCPKCGITWNVKEVPDEK